MKRGDFITVILAKDYGKPRPALVIQADQFSERASVTVLPMTSTLISAPLFRIELQPTQKNGLKILFQVMVDKAMTVSREKTGEVFGSIEPDVLLQIDRCLAIFLGIAK
jgi:mRNA interferase MazF